jgi:hypothetical protein
MIEVAAKLYVGDVVEMRKVHPCGGYVWEIVRVGADIGLLCRTCGRRVLLPRRDFARGVKRFVQRGAGAELLDGDNPAGSEPPDSHAPQNEQKKNGQTGDMSKGDLSP